MKIKTLLTLCFALLLTVHVHAAGTFYVAPGGSGPGTIDAPMGTFDAAIAAVQAAGGGNVVLRGGTIPITAKQTITTPNITITNYPGETPIVSGGTSITLTQTDVSRDIWSGAAGSTPFRTLWVNGVRAPRARMYTNHSGWSRTSTGFSGTSGFGNVARPQDCELIFRQLWTETRVPMTAASGTTITCATNAITTWHAWVDGAGGGGVITDFPTEIEGAVELLNGSIATVPERGTHALDNGSHTIYYCRNIQVNPANCTSAIAGTFQDQMLVINASNITISSVTFAYTSSSRPQSSEGFIEAQGGVILDSNHPFTANNSGTYAQWARAAGCIELVGATNCTITNCKFQHIGTDCIREASSSRGNKIIGNQFLDISASAIIEGDPAQVNLTTPTGNNTITHNTVTNYGQEFHGANGVMVFYCDHETINNNEVSFGNYSGISLGFGWGTAGNTVNSNHDNVVNANKVHDCLLIWQGSLGGTIAGGLLVDGGGIYCNGASANNTLDGNVVYNVVGIDTSKTQGVYCDDGSCNYSFTNLVVKNCNTYFYSNLNASPYNSLAVAYVDAASNHTGGVTIGNCTISGVGQSADPFVTVGGAAIVAAAGPQGPYTAAPSPFLDYLGGTRWITANGSYLRSTSAIQPPDEVSCFVWVRPFFNSASDNNVHPVLDYFNPTGTVRFFLGIQNDSAHKPLGGWQVNGTDYTAVATSAVAVHYGQPMLLGFTASKANAVTDLWLNGVKIGTRSGAITTGTVTTATIGDYDSGEGIGNTHPIVSAVRDFAMWNKVLSDAEIAKLQYQRSCFVAPTHLISFLPIGGSASPEVNSVSGGGNFTVTNTTGIADEPVFPPTTIATPTGFTLMPASSGARGFWASSAGATGYRLYSSADGYLDSVSDFTGFPAPIASLTNGTTYTYKIAAFGPNGESGQSSAASVTPSAAAPPAPSLLAAPLHPWNGW